MKSLRRNQAEPEPVEEPEVSDEPSGKGRPTPKRRDTSARRGPVKAPQTRKEAYAWQKQQKSAARTTSRAGTGPKPRNAKEYRQALRAGDESVIPARDRGPVRRLARDYVDSRRMLSNYLLLLFIPMILGTVLRQPIMNAVSTLLFLAVVLEWYLTGRRIRALALERFDNVQSGPMKIGLYAGQRAYLPRKWRIPTPQTEIGDQI